MDNASKALIMAGGILIAVMVIGLAMYLLSGARGFADASNKQAEISAAESFNRYYLSFDSTITGIDVLNLYNKAKDDSNRANHTHVVDTSGISADLINTLSLPDGSVYWKNTYNYSYSFDSNGYINKISVN